MRAIDLTGKKFGRLTAISLSLEKIYGRRAYLCRCECGTQKNISGETLSDGRVRSCGCLAKERIGALRRSHGESRRTKEYRAWLHLKGRCECETDHKYPLYGGRGIRMCDRWRKYENFLADMGRAPSASHSIDRIDVNGHYEPTNCRWATAAQQSNNRRKTLYIDFRGERLPLKEWCDKFAVSYKLAWARIKKKVPLEQVFGVKL